MEARRKGGKEETTLAGRKRQMAGTQRNSLTSGGGRSLKIQVSSPSPAPKSSREVGVEDGSAHHAIAARK